MGWQVPNRLSAWEHGTAVPSITNLFKLACLYRTTPQQLYKSLYTELRLGVQQKKRRIKHPSKGRVHYRNLETTSACMKEKTSFESREEAIEYLASILFQIFLHIENRGALMTNKINEDK